MNSVDKAVATQLSNIEKRTGKTLDELAGIVKTSGLTKHGEIRDMLKRDLVMGHGDANTLTHFVLRSAEPAATEGEGAAADVVDGIYSGAKAPLRPIHNKLMAEITKLGPFEIAPKKGYLSLRRKKQFATIGPATNTRVEVGLNMKGVPATDRLEEMPAQSMCQYKVRVTEAADVDAELIAWIRQAYESAG